MDALKAQNALEVENVLYEIKSEISPNEIPEEDKNLFEKSRTLLARMKNKRRMSDLSGHNFWNCFSDW